MWDVLVLAGAGGMVSALGIWAFLARALNKSPRQRVAERLKNLTGQAQAQHEGPASTLARVRAASGLSREILKRSWGADLQLFLEQAGVQMNVGTYALLHAVGAAIIYTAASWFNLNWFWTVALTAAGGSIPSALVARKRQKRFSQLTEQLPEAIRMISSTMRAGLGMDSGIEIVAKELPQPIRGEFHKLLNERRLYTDVNEAFRRMTRRLPLRDYRLFAAASSLHREVGGNFAELLDQLETTIRGRFQLNREMKTLTAEGRLSGLILGIFPLVVAGGMVFLNPAYFSIMWENKIGRLLLYGAVVWQFIGFLIIRWMTTPRFK